MNEEPPKSLASAEYEDRFILFMDILGFKEAIQSQDEKKLLKINSLLSKLASYNHEGYTRTTPKGGETWVPLSTFSDCILATMPANEPLAHLAIKTIGCMLQNIIMQHGFLCRGVLFYGKAYHSGAVAYGKGIVDAYLYESSKVKVPAIIVHESALNAPEKGATLETFEFMGQKCFNFFTDPGCDLGRIFISS